MFVPCFKTFRLPFYLDIEYESKYSKSGDSGSTNGHQLYKSVLQKALDRVKHLFSPEQVKEWRLIYRIEFAAPLSIRRSPLSSVTTTIIFLLHRLSYSCCVKSSRLLHKSGTRPFGKVGGSVIDCYLKISLVLLKYCTEL